MVDGTIEVQALGAPVEIVRDAHAVPHIEAESLADAVFAQGFVHAQDRLWQMDFRRRLGSGRLAEVLGPAALPTDRFMRTLGFERAARGEPRASAARYAWSCSRPMPPASTPISRRAAGPCRSSS